jgi:hypothetical protein
LVADDRSFMASNVRVRPARVEDAGILADMANDLTKFYRRVGAGGVDVRIMGVGRERLRALASAAT